jgi:hypothetical protein
VAVEGEGGPARVGGDAGEETVGGGAEFPADDAAGAGVAGLSDGVALIVECAVLPLAAVVGRGVVEGDFGGRAVEGHSDLAAAAAEEDDGVVFDAEGEASAHAGLVLLGGAAIGAVLDVDPLAVDRLGALGLRRRRGGGRRGEDGRERGEEGQDGEEPEEGAHGGDSGRERVNELWRRCLAWGARRCRVRALGTICGAGGGRGGVGRRVTMEPCPSAVAGVVLGDSGLGGPGEVWSLACKHEAPS